MSISCPLLRPIVRPFRKFHFRLLRVLFYSDDSHHRLAMGAFWGLFWGLTPTVGLQTLLLLGTMVVIFALNRLSGGRFKFLEFNFVVAYVLTWISNPADAPVLYFLFYAVGVAVIPGVKMLQSQEIAIMFKPVFDADGYRASFDALWALCREIGYEVIFPMFLGGFVLGIPVSIAAYFATMWAVKKISKKRIRKPFPSPGLSGNGNGNPQSEGIAG